MSRTLPRRLVILIGFAVGASALSCGRDVTGPHGNGPRASFSVAPLFPEILTQTSGAGSAVAFNRIRIVLHRADGTVALDTVVSFPPGTDSIPLTLTVPLSPTTPTTGEPLALNLAYLNAAGDTVFKGGPIALTVTPTVPGASPPPPVRVPVKYSGPGASATAVRISPKSLSTTTNSAIAFTAQAVDAGGAVIAGTPIVFGSLDPSRATVNANGSGQTLGQRGSARIFAALLTGPTDTATITIQPVPSAIALVSGGGQSGTVSKPLGAPLVVRVTAGDGLGVSGVNVAFAVASGGGSVGGSAVTGSDGTAQTAWTLGSAVGTQTVTATATGVAGSVTFSATATQPRLAFSGGIGTVQATVPFAVNVTMQDGSGAALTSFNGPVSLGLGNNPASDALAGTLTANAVNGVASFTGLTLRKVATGVTLSASANGVTTITSDAFDVGPGPASKLVFTVQPTNAAIGGSIGSIAVAARDAADNPTPSFVGTVTLALNSSVAGAALSGVVSVPAIAGVASFGGLSVNAAGIGYTLTASSGSLASATSLGFTVASGVATTIQVINGANQTAAVGAALSPITVLVTDAGGNPKPGVAITFAVATGGGSLSTTSATTSTAGQASTTWTLGLAGGTQTITATAAGIASPITISATATGATNHWVVGSISAAPFTAGHVFSQTITASLLDGSNAAVTSFNGPTTISIASNPGGATLSGTTTVNAVNGQVTFSGLSLNKIGTAYSLRIGSTGATSGVSNTFDIVAGPAVTMALQSGNLQNATPGTQLPQPIVIFVTDSLGNPVTGKVVNVAVSTGGGSVSTLGPSTNASGLASFTWTLGGGAGAQTLTVSASGLAGSPITVTANSGGAIKSTVVTPHLDTLTAIGATFSLAAQAKDSVLNAVAGSFTWTTRSAAIATVNSSGVVTAVSNGTTWVIATEAGGTKDSAQIVVQQRLATISVTPNPRNIYLGASFTFAASAVDGLGVALTTQPTFTWGSATPAIATVNASTGVATGTGLGSTLVQATSGSVVGTATINVLTPITRIVVSRDSAGFATTTADNFTLAALGKTRSYRATARDTLDNAMTGVTFTWSSTNSAVAGLDSINTTSVRATAAANGNTRVTATAQGIAGFATLTVAQVLTAIDLSPTTATIAPTGSVALVARGKDANGFFISGGGPFRFTSGSPTNATVDSLTGVVTGVANGSATITATNAAHTITSNTAILTIGGAVPATISFGRDTLTIGRSATNVSIPIYLSKPFGSAVTINLAVADTFANWATASVNVPAGQTSVNASLNGHNSGTTHVTASDGSGAGYASGTSVLAVQATVRFTSNSYSVNATDQFNTQVLLSDPSPAGGTFITYNYGTAGRASVSPDPAFIPAGQLSANVVTLGVAGGSTTITPVATGVNGTATTVTVYPANLTQAYSTVRLGAGQYETYPYVYAQTNMNSALAVSLTSGDTSKVAAPASVVFPVGSNYSYYQISGKSPTTAGPVNITASATGWTSASTAVTVTTPKVGVSGGGTYITTSPQFGFTVYAEDSTSAGHYRSSALVVSISSSDTTVMKVLTPTVTIPAGQYYTSAALAVPGGAGGSARIRVTASGHLPDSVSYTVIGPQLSITAGSFSQLGAGQQETGWYVYTPNNVTGSPLVVTLNNSDSTVAGLPPTVTIPVGTNYVYFTTRAKAVGQVTVTAAATGFTTSSTWTIRVSSPRVTLSGGGTLNNFGPAQGFTAYSADSSRNGHYRTAPLVLTYTSTNTSVITVTGSDTIQAGAYYTSHGLVTPVGVGTAKLIVSAPGHLPDTVTYTVQTPQLAFSFGLVRIGRRQYDQNYYVYVPNNRTSNLTVTIAKAHAAVDSLTSTTLTIPSGTNYVYFNIAGMTTGTDTLTATAPGYNPATATIVVTTPKFTNSGLPSSATTTSPPSTLNVYATDSVGTGHYVLDTVIVKATSSNNPVLQPTAAGFRILPGTYYTSPQVAYTGPGTATITYSDSLGSGYQPTTTNAVTVTGPSLAFSNNTPVLGMRQNGGVNSAYVYVPNNVTGSPLTVNLASTDPTVVTVPASVTIPVGTNYAYFTVTAHDVVGTIQVQATATGYGGATTNVQVTAPKFVVSTTASINTTSTPQAITVYAEDANGTTHYTNENVPVTLVSSSTAVGAPDSSVVTIVAGQYYNNAARFVPASVGTAQLSASDARVASYKYNPGTQNIAVNTPTLSVSSSPITLGVGQYFDQTFYTPDNQPTGRTLNFAHFSGATTSPTSAIIANGGYYTSARITAASVGIDTITASATAHNPVKGAVTVVQAHSDPIANFPATLSLTGTDSVFVTLYTRESTNGTQHPVAANTTFSISGNAHVSFYITSGSPVTSVTVPAGASYVQFWVKGTSTGTDSAITFTNANYAAQTLSLTVNP